MKYRYLFFGIISGMAFLTGLAWAQEDNVSVATADLQSALSTLQQSANRLNADNDQLADRDKYIKEQIAQLQMQWNSLQNQGDVLNKQAGRMQGKNPRRDQKIFRLEAENADLVNLIQRDENNIQSIRGAVPVVSQAPVSEDAQRRQKEKLRLIKMVYDSQERQESLNQSIMAFQKNAPVQPAADDLERQQFLKGQIKDLESEIAAYPPESPSVVKAGPSDQWDDAQLGQLAAELKSLEQNYAQLKNLMDQMAQKTHGSPAMVDDRVEGDKLQGSIEELNRQSQGLRADLDDLRTQMVDLDKRKTHLEMMIKQLP